MGKSGSTPGGVAEVGALFVTLATAQLSLVTGVPRFTLVALQPELADTVTSAGQLIVGGVVSTTVTIWLRFVLFPQPSFAVHVRVMMLVEPTAFVTVTTLGTITPAHASVNTGALNTGAAGHSMVALAPCAVVTSGAVVSTTVITWLRFVLFPHPSFAVHVRVMRFVQPNTFVTVTTLGVITPVHASVNTGVLNTGAAGHSIVAFAPCAVVTAGGVVSITVIT